MSPSAASSVIAKRLFDRDGSLWCADPAGRKSAESFLGWLDLPERMAPHLDEIRAFAESCRELAHVVVLGMGGSSLCAEVIRSSFGQRKGWPQLLVLDSILPDSITSLEESIDLERTLFLVASKSGTTIEPLSLYEYFREKVERAGLETGRHFVAITDPGSRLEREAEERKFRRVFLNFEDVGGRYSALSFFGLVPAALAGVDITEFLRLAEDELLASRAGSSAGLALGDAIGQAWASGRDKLVLHLPPGYQALGLWIEQLVAESTGKDDRGILPVIGEPLPETGTRLSEDRFDIGWLGDELEREETSLTLPQIAGPLDLARQFVIWEVATAVAGAHLEVNPFDQPDVQAAKDLTRRILGDATKPDAPRSSSTLAITSAIRNASYLALLAWVEQTTESDQALQGFRRAVLGARGVVTTVGYGPRYLHSTGQYHKGAGSGGVHIFLLPKTIGSRTIPIPDTSMTFGELALAQALGDIGALDARDRTVFVIDEIDDLDALAREID